MELSLHLAFSIWKIICNKLKLYPIKLFQSYRNPSSNKKHMSFTVSVSRTSTDGHSKPQVKTKVWKKKTNWNSNLWLCSSRKKFGDEFMKISHRSNLEFNEMHFLAVFRYKKTTVVHLTQKIRTPLSGIRQRRLKRMGIQKICKKNEPLAARIVLFQ